MKESRQSQHDGRRLLDTIERRVIQYKMHILGDSLTPSPQPLQNVMSQILKEEIVEFEKDIEKQEQIYRELMEEADQWLYEEMELAEETVIDRLLDLDGHDIFCPVCQKSNLAELGGSVISCPCGVRFVFREGLPALHSQILRLVVDHEKACATRLQFFAEPSPLASDLSSLNAYCASCEFYTALIV